ncbi:MAG: sigma-70 family RNA polymerase sigma factor, partial [Kiritimatiellae bacterium]|nr:sigma-70 family RNA polymerase sigma factor [Kiritimatiellia bacterium]
MTDEELVEAARKYEKVILNFFVQCGVSPFDAEDMAQQVYLRLWKYSSRYRPSASLLTFLHLVARQVMLDARRGAIRRSQREESWAMERPEA